MVDFGKLLEDMKTPEGKARSAARIKAVQDRFEAQRKANQFMVDRLMPLVADGEINNEWEMNFLRSVERALKSDLPLSEKQEKCLTKIFEKW